MNEPEYSKEEIIAMLVAIYKKVDDLERKMKGGTRMAGYGTYLAELTNLAEKITKM